MALTPIRPYNEVAICESTTSIATTPVAAYGIAPVTGYIQRVMAAAAGTTTGTITVAVTINGGSDIANSTLTIAAGSGNVPTTIELNLVGAGTTSGVHVNEGDLIAFTPSGGTGSSIGGAFAAVIRAQN
jgi:hypothetical protein